MAGLTVCLQNVRKNGNGVNTCRACLDVVCAGDWLHGKVATGLEKCSVFSQVNPGTIMCHIVLLWLAYFMPYYYMTFTYVEGRSIFLRIFLIQTDAVD